MIFLFDPWICNQLEHSLIIHKDITWGIWTFNTLAYSLEIDEKCVKNNFCFQFSVNHVHKDFFFVKSTYFVIDFSRKVIPPTISTKCVLTFQTCHFGNWNYQKTNLAFHGFIQRSFAGWGLKVVFDFLVILVRWDYFGFGK